MCPAQASEDTWWLGQAALVQQPAASRILLPKTTFGTAVLTGWNATWPARGGAEGRPLQLERCSDSPSVALQVWAGEGVSPLGLSLPSLKCPNKYLAVFFH